MDGFLFKKCIEMQTKWILKATPEIWNE